MPAIRSATILIGTRAKRTALLAAFLCVVGCARAQGVDREIGTVQSRLEQVLSLGAYYCAPRELAQARAHLEFARVELAQGHPDSAEQHLAEATLNARAAERLSPQARCAGASPSVSALPRTDGPDGDEDGVEDGVDACPDQREDEDGYLDGDGCPELDNDQDGLPDSLESCPNQAEDKDGYRDDDGCPDLDNDNDGVDDAIDRCPAERGTAANEGCLRVSYKGVEITPTALRVAEPVQFEQDTATIRSVSFALLDTVVSALGDHPEVRIEIQGHTDSAGDDQRNLEMSQSRAEAVLRYLVDHGVDAARLTARGYGETRPMESNRTSQGREINRRVEFVRTDATP